MNPSKLPTGERQSSQMMEMASLVQLIQQWSTAYGFQQLAICDTDLSRAEVELQAWLDKGYHADMDYMAKHGKKRTRPELLIENTCRIISLRMDYYPELMSQSKKLLSEPSIGYISRYALGRDYHKLMRQRLKQLVRKINETIPGYHFRIFVDSAPVMEKDIAVKAGLGWKGKHSNIINRQSGSWFFLAEIYTDLPLPISHPPDNRNHCGQCTACIDTCPTRAIVSPYIVDARLCISYLTIENRGSIPRALRPLMGNRIYGCDDCQLFCPWNRFSQITAEADFQARHELDNTPLTDLFNWSETTFLSKLEGNPIRRIGYWAWLRNIAVALGNLLSHPSSTENERKQILTQLKNRQRSLKQNPVEKNELVLEHIQWAIDQSDKKLSSKIS